MNRGILVVVIVIAMSGLGWFLNALAYGVAGSEEIRTQFVTELEDFRGYAEHQKLLLVVIDLEHDVLYQRTKTTSRKGFNYEKYRDGMYLKLINALRDADEKEEAAKLDRFRGE